MPLEETEPIYQTDQNNPIHNILISCDLCQLHMYYNRIIEKRILPESENGVYICPACARKIVISDLKALSLDD
jgi:predicted SprT family Zn-dependent metalloprotease